jgi:hypothetical protein
MTNSEGGEESEILLSFTQSKFDSILTLRQGLKLGAYTANIKIDIQKSSHSLVEIFVDIHGHSNSKNLFIYGCKGINPSDKCEIKEFPETIEKESKLLNGD